MSLNAKFGLKLYSIITMIATFFTNTDLSGSEEDDRQSLSRLSQVDYFIWKWLAVSAAQAQARRGSAW
jgi:hypothetical protein